MVMRWLARKLTARRTPRQAEARIRAAEAVSLQRRQKDISVTEAARQAGTTRPTVLRYFASSYQKDPSGRYRVSHGDRERYDMVIVSEGGVVEHTVSGSGKRSL